MGRQATKAGREKTSGTQGSTKLDLQAFLTKPKCALHKMTEWESETNCLEEGDKGGNSEGKDNTEEG